MAEKVQGSCPACGSSSLFLGEGGYVTCGVLECRNPGLATTLLEVGTSLPDLIRSGKRVHRIIDIRDQLSALLGKQAVFSPGWEMFLTQLLLGDPLSESDRLDRKVISSSGVSSPEPPSSTVGGAE